MSKLNTSPRNLTVNTTYRTVLSPNYKRRCVRGCTPRPCYKHDEKLILSDYIAVPRLSLMGKYNIENGGITRFGKI